MYYFFPFYNISHLSFPEMKITFCTSAIRERTRSDGNNGHHRKHKFSLESGTRWMAALVLLTSPFFHLTFLFLILLSSCTFPSLLFPDEQPYVNGVEVMFSYFASRIFIPLFIEYDNY
jgi:hypothetical protein